MHETDISMCALTSHLGGMLWVERAGNEMEQLACVKTSVIYNDDRTESLLFHRWL